MTSHLPRHRSGRAPWLTALLLALAVPAGARALTAGEVIAAPERAANGPYLLVLNKLEATMAIVDPATLKVVATVPTGEGPHEVVTTADGKLAVVANYGGPPPAHGNSLSIIDLATKKELRRVSLGALLRPHGLVESGGKIYFTAEMNRSVGRYDPAADKVDWLMGLGQMGTHMVVAAPDGSALYTANIGSDSVSVIRLGQAPPPEAVTHIPVGRMPEGIDISPDGREVWAGHNKDGGISIIDTQTRQVKQTLPQVAKVPIRVRFTPDGRRVLVSDPEGSEVIVIDAATRKVLKRLPLAGVPLGIVTPPDGKRAYIAAMGDGKVHVLDLEKLVFTGSVSPGQGPDGLAWAKGG